MLLVTLLFGEISRFNGLSQGNKVSLLSFVPPCVREFGYGLRGDASMCNIAWSKILIANVHSPLLDYFKNELHVADVLPIADSAYPIVIDTPTIRLRNIDNIEIVKTGYVV